MELVTKWIMGAPYKAAPGLRQVPPGHSGAMRSIERGISRFRVRAWRAPRN